MALGSLLGALGSLVGGLGASGRFLEVPWKVAVGPGGSLREQFLYTRAGAVQQKTKKNAINRKKCNNMTNAVVATKLLVFLNKCCCNQRTGGVPLPFVHLGTII